MGPSISLRRVAIAALGLSPVVSAGWLDWLPALDTVVVRRDDTTTAKSPSPTPTPSGKTDTKVISTNLNTGGISVSPSASGTDKSPPKNGTTTSKPTHTEFDPVDPAGSVVMITPAATLGTLLYKIGDTVTWGWNYTDLQASPTAIDVLISCQTASTTWTLTQNMTFATSAAFTWDSGAFQQAQIQNPLPVALYTMILYDSDGTPTSIGEAGYLAPFDGFQFGLYTPQAYTPLGEWQCATCSAALSDTERRTLGFAVVMSVVTVLSFTWFVTGFGTLV